ncbi:PfkB family carbohydrate kinase [Streptomyces sp. FL06-04B]|nr:MULTISPECIES: PfkB family carbohydrate kinase [unclassified Streptomyces]MDX2917532.1 PfkB family carbohydrate kinase [Streptomyces sp. NE06-03C]MDX3605713.1 PfkB family carbohydrate kinase [Streptomyces sp. FL06-04B]MDX3736196.1 PfkB family carbohydrate kinase [Streptomyces sp. ID01-15D]
MLLVDRTSHRRVPSFSVDSIGTTAASDTFCRALAVALAEGKDPLYAARWASAAAALSTPRAGA